MVLYNISREDLYFPLYGRVVNKQTRRLFEIHRERRPEIKLDHAIIIVVIGTDIHKDKREGHRYM